MCAVSIPSTSYMPSRYDITVPDSLLQASFNVVHLNQSSGIKILSQPYGRRDMKVDQSWNFGGSTAHADPFSFNFF